MDELSRSRGSEGIRACDDVSHTVTSRGKTYIFPPRAERSSRAQVTFRPLKPLVNAFPNFFQIISLFPGKYVIL